jgi:hypothetical protein
LGGAPAGAVAVLALALAAAAAALDIDPSAGGAVIAALALTSGSAMSFLPIADRSVPEWTPIMMAFALRRLRSEGSFRSGAPPDGVVATAGGRRPVRRIGHPRPSPPAALTGVRLVDARYRDRALGAISDQRGRLLTAVLACRGGSFAMLDREAQERRLARWGALLAGAAVTPVRRLQWVERTVPAQGDELARYLHAERDPGVPLRGTPSIDSYMELIQTTAQVTHEHEVLLAVQVDARRAREPHDTGPMDVLVRETERIARSLEAAEVTVLGALPAGRLARALRTAFDPYVGGELAALQTADPARGSLPEASAWPVGAREHWDHYRADGALHVTYWIAGWPRVAVSPMFMDAILGRSSTVRSVAVTFEPLPPSRSTREVEAAVTRDRADSELRRRFGQSETARQRQAQASTMRRESELAEGHAEVRLAGFVTVSGRDAEELRRSCAEVLEHAARARLELHRMYGQQAEAFTFTLPLCRGLR